MSAEALLRLMTAVIQQSESSDDERYPTQDYDPATGYTFVDCMRSIDCDQSDTAALCKESRKATLLTRQVFTCPGTAELFCIRVERLPSREHQICIGVAQASTTKKVGCHYPLGDRAFPVSVGYACRVGISAMFNEGNDAGGLGTGWAQGTTLAIRVTPEGLSFLRDGEVVGSSFTLGGKFRFGVSLCGEGQAVRIVKAQTPSPEQPLHQQGVRELRSGQWYRWTGGTQRPSDWNDYGQMDFLLDGKPHQVKEGGGHFASFFDSPSPDQNWFFSDLEKFEPVPLPLKDASLPVKQLQCGQWYRWTGGTQRPSYWNDYGQMDFLLDGKPHQVNEGRGEGASFFDSPDPDFVWSFIGDADKLEQVSAPEGASGRVRQLRTGQWYRWTGGTQRPSDWNDYGQMDFLLDGKPHQVKEGGGHFASFFDSPSVDRMWNFVGHLDKFELVAGPEGQWGSRHHPHPLSRQTDPPTGSNEWVCDVCRSSHGGTDPSWKCSPCDFDLCEQCAERERTTTPGHWAEGMKVLIPCWEALRSQRCNVVPGMRPYCGRVGVISGIHPLACRVTFPNGDCWGYDKDRLLIPPEGYEEPSEESPAKKRRGPGLPPGTKVRVGPGEILVKELLGSPLEPIQRLPYAGKEGAVEVFDPSDETYRVGFPDGSTEWFTRGCLTVLVPGDGDEKPMQVFVTTSTGKTLTLTVEPTDTIGAVMAKAQAQREGAEEAPSADSPQRLGFGGKLLEGSRTLTECRIPKCSTLFLVSGAVVGSCVICTEELYEEPLPAVPGQCAHPSERTCRACLQRHVSEELNQKGQATAVRCPIPCCRKPLGFEDVRRSASAADFERYDRLALNGFLQAQPEFRWCMASSTCGSGQLHESGAQAPIMTCHSCKGKTCFAHSVPWHAGLTCEAYDERRQQGDAALEDFLLRETKPCPNCGMAIQKNEGCDHMTCEPPGGCGHEFCWRCLAPHAKIVLRGNHHHQPTCIYYSEFHSDGEGGGDE